jgi:hypothetical protein
MGLGRKYLYMFRVLKMHVFSWWRWVYWAKISANLLNCCWWLDAVLPYLIRNLKSLRKFKLYKSRNIVIYCCIAAVSGYWFRKFLFMALCICCEIFAPYAIMCISYFNPCSILLWLIKMCCSILNCYRSSRAAGWISRFNTFL